MKLFCAMCREELEEKSFTKFDKNPALNDRNGMVVVCRECCSHFIEENGNTVEALRNLLRIIDVPYIEKYAISALASYEKKRNSTNVVIKKNVFSDKEEIQGIESIQLQTTVYTCYSSRLGVMPKGYINFSYSDGLRNDNIVTETPLAVSEPNKAVNSAIRFLSKTYGEEIYNDKVRLVQAIRINMEELSLHRNNTTKRQTKFKLKNHITALTEAGILDKDCYGFIFETEEGKAKVPEDIMDNNFDETTTDITVPNDMDMDKLRIKWGEDFKDKEIIKFENKYRDLIKNYEIKTSAHDEFLRLACVSSVRGQECMARNDVDGAKIWMGMFKDLTSAGKLQPQQMSKADLSGGLNNFGEFYKSIELAKGVIEILPVFKSAPNDDADFVLYCLVQYVRRLKGLPDIKYEDIWDFYDELAGSFEGDDKNIINDLMNEIEDIEEDEEGEENGE